MNTVEHSFFGWNSRRVVLERPCHATPEPQGAADAPDLGIGLDVSLTIGARRARLITLVDHDADDYVALVIGDVPGGHDVPVRPVEEEMLLIEGSRSDLPAEILIAVPAATIGRAVSGRRTMDSQLCMGGPVRDIVLLTGAISVTFEWCDATTTGAA
ncbi:hypothetical protein ACFWAY_29995 [Rhodococcus sp. NPDC059968]|uniref:hypothetical protein n=1 Tax=Rhodococcus sp. NPDC059968 TaxID=3347017 RepID=UPI003670ED3A